MTIKKVLLASLLVYLSSSLDCNICTTLHAGSPTSPRLSYIRDDVTLAYVPACLSYECGEESTACVVTRYRQFHPRGRDVKVWKIEDCGREDEARARCEVLEEEAVSYRIAGCKTVITM